MIATRIPADLINANTIPRIKVIRKIKIVMKYFFEPANKEIGYLGRWFYNLR